MNMEMKSILESIQKEIAKSSEESSKNIARLEKELQEIKGNFDGIEARFSEFESKCESLESKFKKSKLLYNESEKTDARLQVIMEELEDQNFDRHLELRDFIIMLSEDIGAVEMVGANMYRNLLKLKNCSRAGDEIVFL